MAEFDNLSGQEHGIWKVLAFDHMAWNGTDSRHGMSYYICECKRCGAIRLKARSQLMQRPCRNHRGCGVEQSAKVI